MTRVIDTLYNKEIITYKEHQIVKSDCEQILEYLKTITDPSVNETERRNASMSAGNEIISLRSKITNLMFEKVAKCQCGDNK